MSGAGILPRLGVGVPAADPRPRVKPGAGFRLIPRGGVPPATPSPRIRSGAGGERLPGPGFDPARLEGLA